MPVDPEAAGTLSCTAYSDDRTEYPQHGISRIYSLKIYTLFVTVSVLTVLSVFTGQTHNPLPNVLNLSGLSRSSPCLTAILQHYVCCYTE